MKNFNHFMSSENNLKAPKQAPLLSLLSRGRMERIKKARVETDAVSLQQPNILQHYQPFRMCHLPPTKKAVSATMRHY